MIPFINEYSCRCMLGSLSRDVKIQDGVFSWVSQKKQHVVLIFNRIDLDTLARLKEIGSASIHYLSEDTANILKQEFVTDIGKGKSVVLDIKTNDFSGNKNKSFRNYLNKYSNLELRENLKDTKDLGVMLKQWSLDFGQRYFRDMSSKNKFFIENGFHVKCENLFVYRGDELVSFGIASPVRDGGCAYIIGKALSRKYPGLADFTDLKLYQRLFDKYGPFKINMGQGEKGLLAYKMKFPGAHVQVHYHGSFKVQ